MIIAKSEPFTKEEIKKLKEQFDVYIKTVIDIKKKVCSAGADRHFESEKILLDNGSKQSDLWGGGIDEIQDAKIREEFEKLTKYFFEEIYG